MKTSIYARVAAQPISFPDVIEMRYTCLDDEDRPTDEHYRGIFLTWLQVQQRFWMDAVYAKECEAYFANGETVFIGNRHLIGKFFEQREIVPVELRPHLADTNEESI
ncbi:MAG: hypothetical protein ACRD3K_04590 [Edaphobacter sp.]